MFRRTVIQGLFTLPVLAQTAKPLVNPLQFGARADGRTDDTAAVQKAIDTANASGGGTVHLTAGYYRSGTLHLKSNVSLWLDNGATIVMSPDLKDFVPPERLPSRSGADTVTSTFRHALIWGDNVESVAIFGQGTIECRRTRVGGPKPISLRRCSRVSLRGITIRNAPAYNISLLGCDYVEIDGISIFNGYQDGITPDSCRFLRVANCFVESVNDAFVLKSSGVLGDRRHTEHVTVSNCVLRTASIHLKCGTESCGDFRNITFTGCTLVGGMGGRHGNPGVALYTVDGGALETVAVSNITMQDVGVPIALLRGNRDRCAYKQQPGVFRNVSFSNIVAAGAKLPSVIAGLQSAPIEDVRISGLHIVMGRPGSGPDTLEAVPEKPLNYPDPTMFGPLPASALFIRHAARLSMTDLWLTAKAEDKRPPLVVDDARQLSLLDPEMAGAWMNNTPDAIVRTAIDPKNFRLTGTASSTRFR